MAVEKRSGLEHALARTLDKRRSQSTLRKLTTNPPGCVDFSSNDFLSLATSPELRSQYRRELDDNLTRLGSGGSRLLDGNSRFAEQIERELASFHNAPAGLLCNSGFDANVSLFSTLPQPGDVVLYDELIHASVRDGMKASRAGRCTSFKHSDVAALSVELERCLQDPRVRHGQRNVFVAIEGVYSMDGDVAPVAEVVDVVDGALPNGNGHLVIDEAHSTGVLGEQGRGLVCRLGLEDRVAVRLHTFGKAMACSGAVVLCSEVIKQYLINFARPLIYTTFMSHSELAAIRASYKVISDRTTQQLRQRLATLITTLYDSLRELEFALRLADADKHLFRVPETRSISAISYILTSRPKSLQQYCMQRGYVVRGILPPTVPAGTQRVRICLHARNTIGELDGLIGTIGSWVEDVRSVERDAPVREDRARL